MGIGIQVCGLNGCGKSTLGRALAARMGFHFIDIEDLYFTRIHSNEPYTNPRSREDVERLLIEEIRKHDDFVFSAVKGDYGEEVMPLYDYVVKVEVPKEIRMQRVRNRSAQKFGSRILKCGDLYTQEGLFFQMVESRDDDFVENWLKTLNCPIIRVDGTKPILENIERIVSLIYR